jgi:hypothetical protein
MENLLVAQFVYMRAEISGVANLTQLCFWTLIIAPYIDATKLPPFNSSAAVLLAVVQIPDAAAFDCLSLIMGKLSCSRTIVTVPTLSLASKHPTRRTRHISSIFTSNLPIYQRPP